MPDSVIPAIGQIGYVTRDLDAAITQLAQAYGMAQSARRYALELTIDGRECAVVNVGRIDVAGLVLKVVQPLSGAVEIWRDSLPSSGPVIVHHHLTSVIKSEAQFESLLQQHRRSGRSVVIEGRDPGRARFAYVDTVADLGHYLELAVPAKD